jgi:hypothetical protein
MVWTFEAARSSRVDGPSMREQRYRVSLMHQNANSQELLRSTIVVKVTTMKLRTTRKQYLSSLLKVATEETLTDAMSATV